jgi:hypothetical protein
MLIVFLPKKVSLWFSEYFIYENKINKVLETRRPFLKYEGLVYVLFGLSLLLVAVYPFNMLFWYNAAFWSLLIIFIVGVFIFEFRKLEKEESFYKKSPFSKGQKRFFPAEGVILNKTVMLCKKCVPVVFPILMFGGGIGPKIVYGYDYRPPLFNVISYPFTKIWSNNEMVYNVSVKLIENNPELLTKITLEDGYTVTFESLRPYLGNEKLIMMDAWNELSK